MNSTLNHCENSSIGEEPSFQYDAYFNSSCATSTSLKPYPDKVLREVPLSLSNPCKYVDNNILLSSLEVSGASYSFGEGNYLSYLPPTPTTTTDRPTNYDTYKASISISHQPIHLSPFTHTFVHFLS